LAAGRHRAEAGRAYPPAAQGRSRIPRAERQRPIGPSSARWRQQWH
jgi:hypothetical protein